MNMKVLRTSMPVLPIVRYIINPIIAAVMLPFQSNTLNLTERKTRIEITTIDSTINEI
jgi:hypothetical protein